MLALVDGEPVGTARVLVGPDRSSAKIGRVAVLAAARGHGIGVALMQSVLDEPVLRDIVQFDLHAQSHATHFYERQGYKAVGAPFIEAGIPHVAMRLTRGRHRGE